MKILCEYTPSGPAFVRGGWKRAFESAGHEFVFWNPQSKSAFDAFSENGFIDLFIGTTYNLDRAVYKNIVARPEMRVILFASAWGEAVDDIDREQYPLVICSEQERGVIAQLKQDTGKPDFVFIHVTDKYLEPTMGGWRSIGVEPHGILNAFDAVLYQGAQSRPELECDLGFVGGYWPYKARNIDKYLIPLCHPKHNLRTKIFGTGNWPVHQYLGRCSDADNRDLFRSAKVCPNVSEPHSTATELGWDIVERVFKVLGCGGLCISDPVDELRELFTSQELIVADSPEDFRHLVLNCIHSRDRSIQQPIIDAGQKKVLENHTYHHRVARMLSLLNMESESHKVLNALKTFV